MTDRSGKSRQKEGDDLQGQRSPQRYFKSLGKKKKCFLIGNDFIGCGKLLATFDLSECISRKEAIRLILRK